jgi:transaldolase
MPSIDDLKAIVRQERLSREAEQYEDFFPMIAGGEGQHALENLIYFTSPADFLAFIERFEKIKVAGIYSKELQTQEYFLSFLAEMVLALRSFLPRWNLQSASRHGRAAMTDEAIASAASRLQAAAVELAARTPQAAESLLMRWRGETTARLKAEQAPDPEGAAQALVGGSIGACLYNLSAAIARSHLRRIAEMRLQGKTRTEISNDYAAFLPYAMYLGASFATTNPPLVNMAWSAEPGRWDPVADRLVLGNPGMQDGDLARLFTQEVVFAQMRLLRPVFLLSEGEMGCVCLQVNPANHADPDAMLADAHFFFENFQRRLSGGVPNVVFKLPGTNAGLAACRSLTRQGIGVTITVNFGMFQHLPFAEAMHAGTAIYSNIVEMSGRLAYPVRDELLANIDKLTAFKIDETKAREAAAWAGIAVVKRMVSLLKAKGYDLGRYKPLIASLRIYQGEGYQSLPNPYPDITEVVGASLISVFPNVRNPFDAHPALELNPNQVDAPVAAELLETLCHSEIFKQAYYVDDPAWLAEEDEKFRPDYPLKLEDEEAVFGWKPVNSTLLEFIKAYETTIQRLGERKKQLQGQSTD